MKILIVAGGSGGHIFPAIALSQELIKRKNAEIVFIASNRKLDRKILKDMSFKKIFLSINPMPHSLNLAIIAFIFKFIYDLFRSLFILAIERPKVVVGFGGYTSGTILLLAVIAGFKTIIHEQNLLPGRANRFLDRFVDTIAISFKDTRKYFNNPNVIFTGNPLRENIVIDDKKAKEPSLYENKRFNILVMGGSQGAHSLNELVSNAIRQIGPDIRDKINIVHITGIKDFDNISNLYKKENIHAQTFSFVKDIRDAYRKTDLAVSRAGAAAIFELSLYAKPMILIPYPFKKNNQRFNAKYFAHKGAAIYREEDHLSSAELKTLIEGLIKNRSMLENLSEGARKLSHPSAAEDLAEEVFKLAY